MILFALLLIRSIWADHNRSFVMMTYILIQCRVRTIKMPLTLLFMFVFYFSYSYISLVRPHLEYAMQVWNPHLIDERYPKIRECAEVRT